MIGLRHKGNMHPNDLNVHDSQDGPATVYFIGIGFGGARTDHEHWRHASSQFVPSTKQCYSMHR